MPCSDVTEVIQVVVDADDRLKSYNFAKRTCGKGVGVGTLILDYLHGRTVDEILAIDPDTLLAEHPFEEEIEEFLNLKHLFAVQGVLEVLTGKASGGPDDVCAAAEIGYEDGEIVVEARILVDLVTEKIKSCGGCKGCGKKKAKVVFK